MNVNKTIYGGKNMEEKTTEEVVNKSLKEEVTEINTQITQDNDITEKSLNKIKNAIEKLNENYAKIKAYLNEQKNQITNPHAKQFLNKIEANINTTEASNNKINILIDDQISNPKTKIYKELYTIPEEMGK